MTRRIRLLFGVLSCLATPCTAGALNPQPAAPRETHPPMAPPSASQPPPEMIAPADRPPTAGNNTLSDKLSRQQGTLKPPAIDPGMQVQPRTQGTMPVIPPPATPGGDPKVVPK